MSRLAPKSSFWSSSCKSWDVSQARSHPTRPRHQRIKQALRALRPRRYRGRQGFLGIGRRLLWSWWLWTAVAVFLLFGDHWKIGTVAVSLAVFTYLVTPQERSPRYGLESEFTVRSHEFLSSMAGTTGVQFLKNNQLVVLNNGDEIFPSMLDAIAQAEYTVTIEAYIYWAGDIGLQFARALAGRAKAGVTVKVLLDAVGSSTIGKEILGILRGGGVELAWYNPVRWSTIGRFNNRTHRKSLIIDGRIAFTGGAGIADMWTGNAQDPDHWREIQVRIEGPAAMGLQTGFANNWLDTTGELISGAEYFPPPDAAGTIAVQTIMSSPEAGSSAVRIMYYLSIVCSRSSILIANPYFIPDDVAMEILIEAKQRGVDVKIMVAGDHNDMAISRYASMQLYGKLLEAGVELYEYTRTMMHQKTMVVDGIWSTIGTTNFDNRSFSLNEESNLCVYDQRLAQELEQIFSRDLRVCERITLENWRKRGLKARVIGAASLFLKEQI